MPGTLLRVRLFPGAVLIGPVPGGSGIAHGPVHPDVTVAADVRRVARQQRSLFEGARAPGGSAGPPLGFGPRSRRAGALVRFRSQETNDMMRLLWERACDRMTTPAAAAAQTERRGVVSRGRQPPDFGPVRGCKRRRLSASGESVAAPVGVGTAGGVEEVVRVDAAGLGEVVVAGEDAVEDRQRAGVVDASAAIAGLVAGEGAAADRQRAAVVDPAAVPARQVAGAAAVAG